MSNCKQCNTEFEITDDDRKFYKQVGVTEPTFCPDCRQQRRLTICNERFLYPGKCGMCKKRTLTQYPPHLKHPIYCRECWHSDDWDQTEHGRDFDFSKPFFE